MIQSLKNIFIAPTFKDDGSDNLIRFKSSHSIVLFSLVLLTLNIIELLINYEPILSSLYVCLWVILFLTFVYIRRSKKFYYPLLIFCLISFFFTNYNIFFGLEFNSAINIAWSIIQILVSFFILGFRVGIAFTSAFAISFSFYFFYWLHKFPNLDNHNDNYTSNLIYVISSFSIIGFLGYQFDLNTKYSKKNLQNALLEMQDQYNVISKQNEEKTVMLKEIHHRVKNNLQIITSLLRLQSRELESPEAIAKFKDAIHRVIAMSMIHEKMYQNDALSSMHLREYLNDLTNDLISSYQSDYEVKLHIDCNIETIGLRSVVPLALILNELISNTLKYAFDDEKNCWISISFNYLSGNNCKLIYKDGGTWKPPSRKGSFGLDLIESLTYQLDGTMRMETQPETIFEFILAPQIDDDISRFDSENV